MGMSTKPGWPHYLRQVQMITSEISEGVIMIDVSQQIRWANDAALRMHGVGSYGELGRTIDEYHANFRVRFCGSQPAASDRSVESIAAGEAFRDVIIEVTPLQATTPEWSYRVRNMVLVDEADAPMCVVLVIRPLAAQGGRGDHFTSAFSDLPQPAAIIRLRDMKIMQANAGFHTACGADGALQDATALFADGGAALQVAARDRLAAAPVPLQAGHQPVAASALPVTAQHERCVLLSLDQAPPPSPAPALRGWDEAAALCQAAPTPLAVLTDAMEVIAASPALCAWLCSSPAAMKGRKLTAFMTPASAAHFAEHAWPALLAETGRHDHACTFAAGATLTDATIAATVVPAQDGRPAFVIVAPVDVTERNRGQEALAAMFALAPVPMLIRTLEDGRILDANAALLALTDYSPADIVGHGLDEFGLFDSRAARQQFEAGARAEGGVRNVEAHLKTRQGDTLDCLVSARKLFAFGQACMLMTLQDVSLRRRDETQLFQAIETVMEDTSWFSRSVIEKLATVRTPPKNGARVAALVDLTPREREVLGLISSGLADADIAQTLGLTRSTVRNHVATLYSKIDVHSRSSAIIWARERGINMGWPAAAQAGMITSNVAHRKQVETRMLGKLRRV